HVVRVVHEFFLRASLRPVSTVYGGKGSVVTGIVGFVPEGVLNDADWRSHAGPGTAQVLGSFTLHGADHPVPVRISRTLDGGIIPGHHPNGEVVRSTSTAVGKASPIIKFACFGMIRIQQYFVVPVILGEVYIVIRILQCKRSGVINGL